jgi:hypothetical protein
MEARTKGENVNAEQQHKLTPTERLHDLAMAAITKPASAVRGAESVELAQVHMGPSAGRWYCKNLATVAQEGETILGLWSRTLDAALKVQKDVIGLNAGAIRAELEASTERPKPKAVK